MKIRASALILVCVFSLPGDAATVNGNRAATTSVKAPRPAPVANQKPAAKVSQRTSTVVRQKVTPTKARTTVSANARPTPALKWRCEHAVGNHRFRGAHGLVCWDGRIYSEYDGGIPPYMLDYFEGHPAELESASLGNPESPYPGRPAAYTLSTVAPAEIAAAVPVSPEVFASIGVGMARSAALDKLGKPAGSITIPDDNGFVEIWTYKMTDGRTAKLNLENGIVKTLEPKTAALAQ